MARFALAARTHRADHVVRITADCPCVDPQVIDRVVSIHLASESDYASNTLHRSYPRGFDVEVFGAAALYRAQVEARTPHEREHVTPYIHQNPHSFSIISVTAPSWYGNPSWRVCLDTPEDYQMLCELWALCRDQHGNFPALWEIGRVLKRHPALLGINGHIRQKLPEVA